MISQYGWWNVTFNFTLSSLRLNSWWSQSVTLLSTTLVSSSALPQSLQQSRVCWHLDSWPPNFHSACCICHSCHFALHNIRKIRFWLSTLHNSSYRWFYLACNSLLAGLPPCTVKHLQIVQKNSMSLTSHVTPLFIAIHWLSEATSIKLLLINH